MSVLFRRLAPVAFVLLAGIAACNNAVEESLQSAAVGSDAAARPPSRDFTLEARGDRADRTTAASVKVASQSTPAIPFTRQQAAPPAQPSMIIRNGDVAIEVDSVDAAIAAVRQLVASVGGYVGNVSVFTGEHQVRSATLELKVPAARFDEIMAGVRPIGEVERSVATAEDVGEEFVDISARVTNARRLESRLVTLLSTRTGKLEDVLAVERELARVREEIERYEGRIRFLSSRVALSTIAVTVHEKAPLVATTPGTNIIKQAFVNMWRNFVLFVAFGIQILGVLIPMGLLALAAWFGVRRWREKRVTPSTAGAQV
jgi:hypothetical protein